MTTPGLQQRKHKRRFKLYRQGGCWCLEWRQRNGWEVNTSWYSLRLLVWHTACKLWHYRRYRLRTWWRAVRSG